MRHLHRRQRRLIPTGGGQSEGLDVHANLIVYVNVADVAVMDVVVIVNTTVIAKTMVNLVDVARRAETRRIP